MKLPNAFDLVRETVIKTLISRHECVIEEDNFCLNWKVEPGLWEIFCEELLQNLYTIYYRFDKDHGPTKLDKTFNDWDSVWELTIEV